MVTLCSFLPHYVEPRIKKYKGRHPFRKNIINLFLITQILEPAQEINLPSIILRHCTHFLVQLIVQRCNSNTWPFHVVMYICYHDDRTHVTFSSNQKKEIKDVCVWLIYDNMSLCIWIIISCKRNFDQIQCVEIFSFDFFFFYDFCLPVNSRCNDCCWGCCRKLEENVQTSVYTWGNCSGKV